LTVQKQEEHKQEEQSLHQKLGGRTEIFLVDEGHNSKETAAKYRTDFKLFLDYVKIYDLDVLLDLGKEALQVLVIKYVRSLRDDPVKKYSRSTVQNRIASIFYFLVNNDIELNKQKIRRYLPPDESVRDDRPYTLDEIQKILSASDLRTKAMVWLMHSSGCRIGSLHTMRIEDLVPVNYQGQELYKIRVYARTRDEYYSFITPEAKSEGIDPYLDYRVRSDEILKDESPLFRKQFNPFTINKPLPLSQHSLIDVIDYALNKSGVKSKKIMKSHAFRKGFKTICEQSGMKSINVELLLGHSIGVSNSYYRPNESDVLADYMKAADALTVDPTQRLQTKVKELESERAEEIDRLKAQLEEKARQIHQTVEALEIKSKNSIDKIEKEIIKLRNDMIVQVTTDNEHGGTHYYKYKKA
jgi:integrase